jgi:hypothetical protein
VKFVTVADASGHCWRWLYGENGEWDSVAEAHTALRKEPSLAQREARMDMRN